MSVAADLYLPVSQCAGSVAVAVATRGGSKVTVTGQLYSVPDDYLIVVESSPCEAAGMTRGEVELMLSCAIASGLGGPETTKLIALGWHLVPSSIADP